MIPDYPLALAPGVHVILTPHAHGYGDRIVQATVSQHKAIAAWQDTARGHGCVAAQVWWGDVVRHAEWSRDTGLREWATDSV